MIGIAEAIKLSVGARRAFALLSALVMVRMAVYEKRMPESAMHDLSRLTD
jgi:hypothetical protein